MLPMLYHMTTDVEVIWQEGQALWCGVVGPNFDPTIPRHLVRSTRGKLMTSIGGLPGGVQELIVEDAQGKTRVHSGKHDKTHFSATDGDDVAPFAATAGNHKSGHMYDVATGQYKHNGKSKLWTANVPALVTKNQSAGTGRIGLLLDFDDGSLSVYINGHLVGPMVKRGLTAPLYWAVDLGSGDPYENFVVTDKGMTKLLRQTRVSKAFQATSVPSTARIERAIMPDVEYESD